MRWCSTAFRNSTSAPLHVYEGLKAIRLQLFDQVGSRRTNYVGQILIPTLERGETVIDNLSVHKVAGVREAIKAAGAYVLYLPSYSPDLNPIEMEQTESAFAEGG
jgi:hypothetical protein